MDSRKRGRPEAKARANGGVKRSKSESESLGSKSKPCMKYFSMAGCPFGANCHFLHYFPGGYNAVAQMMNLPQISSAPANAQNGSSAPTTKSKLCNKFNTPEGCKFGDKCSFAHGEWELGKPIFSDPRPAPPRFGGRVDPPGIAGGFGASATAKISVEAALSGPIIGKGGGNSKQICRQTGVKLAIRDHESDANLKNIELEGTFEQIKEASAMVRELILSLSHAGSSAGGFPPVKTHHAVAPTNGNKKTKLCENFAKGSCTFGERCHFAHGAAELRRSG